MKIRPIGAELFHADGQTRRSYYSLFEILRTPLKFRKLIPPTPLRVYGMVLKHRNKTTILPDNGLVSVNFVMQLIYDCAKTTNIFRASLPI